MIFLSSLPRSGSTLLTSLLNQRDDVFATPTSNLCDTMGAAVQAWEQNPTTQASGGKQDDLIRILKGISDSRYDTDKLVIDKGRGWAAPQIMETMKRVQGDVKIIATVRPIADCLASFVKIAKPENVKAFCKNGELAQHLFSTYQNLKAGYEAAPENFCLIEYDELIKDPQAQLDRIADFIGVPHFKHDAENVAASEEDDKAWGVKDLHKVRPKVRKRKYSAKKILGADLWNFYQGGEFWNDKPAKEKPTDPLDLQLEASLRGDFDKAWQIAQKLEKERPDCDRAAFNRGWFLISQGELLEGQKCLDRGRNEDVFGNRHIGSTMPIWNGEEGTVLLNLEGGLGDQIHGYRWAKHLGDKVVISCSAELAPIFAKTHTVVQHEAALGVYHDYWLPSMSAVSALGLEYEDLSGTPYIEKTAEPIPGRVGVRWKGNPQFEHEQHREFPADLMFDAVRHMDCVSLQRDEGADLKPDWMVEADLSTWQTTQHEISKCEFVITSCTSVAHMSAAMGVKTWIVAPLLPYYLWALPGDKTPWYNSVLLFRQTTRGDWSAPFKEIKECMHSLKIAV